MISPREPSDFSALRRLAKTAGATGRPIFADIQSVDYDWGVPYHYSQVQLEKLDGLAATLGEALSAALGKHLRKPVELKGGVAQAFRQRLDNQFGQVARFVAPLAAQGVPRGAIVVDVAVAVGWVTRLLGGKEEEADPARKLSALEGELLADTFGVILAAANGVFTKAGGTGLAQAGPPSAEPGELPGSATAEYCCLSFRLASAADRPAVHVALLCECVDPMAGSATEGQATAPVEAGRTALAEHFSRTYVTASAIVGQAELTLRDLMDLAVGDVLLLNAQVCDPIELRVQGKLACTGLLATCGGMYAVEISESLAAGEARPPSQPTPRPAPPKGK